MENRGFIEDSLALPSLVIVGKTHSFELKRYRQHFRVGGIEIDLYAYFTTKSGVERTVLIELKDSDFPKLYEQLLSRVHMANYVYGSINIPAYEILHNPHWRKLLMDLFQRGVGMITWQLKHPQILLKAKFHSNLTTYGIKDQNIVEARPGPNPGGEYEEDL